VPNPFLTGFFKVFAALRHFVITDIAAVITKHRATLELPDFRNHPTFAIRHLNKLIDNLPIPLINPHNPCENLGGGQSFQPSHQCPDLCIQPKTRHISHLDIGR